MRSLDARGLRSLAFEAYKCWMGALMGSWTSYLTVCVLSGRLLSYREPCDGYRNGEGDAS
jgi:hypothetical protein